MGPGEEPLQSWTVSPAQQVRDSGPWALREPRRKGGIENEEKWEEVSKQVRQGWGLGTWPCLLSELLDPETPGPHMWAGPLNFSMNP